MPSPALRPARSSQGRPAVNSLSLSLSLSLSIYLSLSLFSSLSLSLSLSLSSRGSSARCANHNRPLYTERGARRRFTPGTVYVYTGRGVIFTPSAM